MVRVIFSKDSRKRLFSISASGHVELVPSAGSEYSMVCAAVSAILQAARLGLEDYAHVRLEVVQEKGDLRLDVPEDRRDEQSVQAILATAQLSIGQIAKQYPQHVFFRSEAQA